MQIFLGALALQLLSFFCFTCIYMVFLYRVYTHRPDTWNRDQKRPWYKDWRSLAAALFISCIGILVRLKSPPLSEVNAILTFLETRFRFALVIVWLNFLKDLRVHLPPPRYYFMPLIHFLSSMPPRYISLFGQGDSSETMMKAPPSQAGQVEISSSMDTCVQVEWLDG